MIRIFSWQLNMSNFCHHLTILYTFYVPFTFKSQHTINEGNIFGWRLWWLYLTSSFNSNYDDETEFFTERKDAAFYGIGTCSSALLTLRVGIPFIIALPLSGMISGFLGYRPLIFQKTEETMTHEETIKRVREAIKDRAVWFVLLYKSFSKVLPPKDVERACREAIYEFGRLKGKKDGKKISPRRMGRKAYEQRVR